VARRTSKWRCRPPLNSKLEHQLALYEIQLRRYLGQFEIASADILHIKEGRKAMLSACGIDDAADVTRSALETVPGFGHFLIIQLITWRQYLETTFKFNLSRGIDPADIQRVDHEIAKRRGEIASVRHVLLHRKYRRPKALSVLWFAEVCWVWR
jgi:DNA-binding helix-hairpin-helix protein with protein kinase domain